MLFNLIPIPPLDGSRLLGLFISDRAYYNLLRNEHYMIYLIMALSLLGAFDAIIGGGVRTVYALISHLIRAMLNVLV